jgi:DNA helicase IV
MTARTDPRTPVLHPDLTPAQRDCLERLPLHGNHVVGGPPGSGKSLLAAHRAVHLSLTGRRTLLLTRSNLLRQLLRDVLDGLAVPGAPVEASTVHRWITRRFGGAARSGHDGWFDWKALLLAAAESDDTDAAGAPHLVVDEGQDLPPGFYRLARLVAASVTVFADECQRLTETNSTLDEITTGLGRSTGRQEITGNHRNTKEIAALAERFRTGGAPPTAMPRRSGPLPVLRSYRGERDLADHLIRMARRPAQERIGVIVASSRLAIPLVTRLEAADLPQPPQFYSSRAWQGRYRDLDLSRPGVTVVHRASAKGLDFDTVVIPDTHHDAGTDPTSAALRMAYHVMITRARDRVILGWFGTMTPGHLEGLHPWAQYQPNPGAGS